jgi:hypothetical protein
MENFSIFYGHLVFLTTILYMVWSFCILYPMLYQCKSGTLKYLLKYYSKSTLFEKVKNAFFDDEL